MSFWAMNNTTNLSPLKNGLVRFTVTFRSTLSSPTTTYGTGAFLSPVREPIFVKMIARSFLNDYISLATHIHIFIISPIV